MKKVLWTCVVILAAGGAVVAQRERVQAPQGAPGAHPAPPARSIPGVNAPDRFPRVCVDCHVVLPEADVRISTLMNRWREGVGPALMVKARAAAPSGAVLSGRHPHVPEALSDVPAACLTCHGKDAKDAPPFAAMIRLVHLSGGEGNHFMTIFQGECTHCHKLDADSGRWRLASGPER